MHIMLLSGRCLGNLISVFCFLLSCSFCCGVESDINCLKSIKSSLVDPSGYLNSWDFSTEGFICDFHGIECWGAPEVKVLNIKLLDLRLEGQFPRDLSNCRSLIGLALSGNKLTGHLPTDISTILPYVTFLDLSSNSFSGEIPSSLANCSYMNVLKLDNNKFSGQIPPELGQLNKLKSFSVTNNQLSGQVPNFGSNSYITAESYANNLGLCGSPLKPCRSSQNKAVSLVKVLKSNSVPIAAAAGFGFGFSFSFCFFLPRSPSVRALIMFLQRFKS